MATGYFIAEGAFRRPYINAEVSFPDYAGSQPIEIPFVVDTESDLTLISPLDGHRLCDHLGIDINSMSRGNPIGGIGGHVGTRMVGATLVIGSYKTTMQIPIVDLLPGPDGMPSLIGRDIIYDFTLFMEHGADRLFLLRVAEEIIPLLES